MIFVPLLHYFKCKNQYSGSEDGMRYLLSPGKRSVPDPDGGEGAQKEEAILTVDIWPDPWALDRTGVAPELFETVYHLLSPLSASSPFGGGDQGSQSRMEGRCFQSARSVL